jgi:cell division inhibitor SepF
MSVFKKAMSYLGLGPEDAYDDYDLDDEPDQRQVRGRSPYASEPEPPLVRTVPSRPPVAREPQQQPAVRFPLPADNEPPMVRPRSQGSAVRTVPAANPRPHTVRPRRFDQSQEVGDRFKDGQPVIVNLQDLDREVSRRIIDFCAGLCYALDGKMEKVANGVYLLTPANATVSAEDRRLMGDFQE